MRVREEAGREVEEMENTGRGKNRTKSQYRQLYKQHPKEKKTKKTISHISVNIAVCRKILSKKLYMMSDNHCVLGLVSVGYPIGIPPKCRLHLLVMLSCSLQGQGKVTIHKGALNMQGIS